MVWTSVLMASDSIKIFSASSAEEAQVSRSVNREI